MVAEVSIPIRLRLDATAVASGDARLADALTGALGRALGNATTALDGAPVVRHPPRFAWIGPGAAALPDLARVGLQDSINAIVDDASSAAGLPATVNATAAATARPKRTRRVKPWWIVSAASLRCRLADYLEFCNGVLPLAEDLPSLYFDYWEDEVWVSAWIVSVGKSMPVDELVAAVDARQRELSHYVDEKHEVVGLWSIWCWVRRRLVDIDRGREGATLAAMGSPYSVYVDQYTRQERVQPGGRVLFVMALLPRLRWEDTITDPGRVRTVAVQLRDLVDFVDADQFLALHKVKWKTYLAELGDDPAEVDLAPFLVDRPWSFRSLILQGERAFSERTKGQATFGGIFLLNEAAIGHLPAPVRAAAREESNAAVLALPDGSQFGVWPAGSIGAMVWTTIEPDDHKRLIALYRPGGRDDADDVIAILKSDLNTFVKSLRLGRVLDRSGDGEFAARFAFMLDELETRDGGKWLRAFFRVCTSGEADFATHHALITVAAYHWWAANALVIAAGKSLAERSRREADHGYAYDEIWIDKDPSRAIKPGHRLNAWNEQWAYEESEQQLTDKGMKRLEKALHEQTFRFLKEELFAHPDKVWDEDEIGARIVSAATDQTPLEKGDVREVEYLRTFVVHEVRPYDDGGLMRWEIHGFWVRAERGTQDYKFLKKRSRGGWKEVSDINDATYVRMGRGELEEQMFFWEFNQGSKAVIAFSKIVSWGGVIVLVWGVGAIQVLVDIAGGWWVVGTSIAISEFFYLISGEELTFEGFLITALIGYLSALTFRFVTPLVNPFARAIGGRITGESLLRFFAGWLVERAIIGGAVGAATGLMTTLVLDLIHVAAGGGWSSPWDYVRNAGKGMLYGAVFEVAITGVGTLFRAQGLHALKTIAEIAAVLKKNGIRPGALIADFGQCWRTFSLWLREILDMQGAELATAIKQQFNELVVAVAGNVRASMFSRMLDLIEVSKLSSTQARALERLFAALDDHLSVAASLEVTTAMGRVQGRINTFLDALAVLDDASLVLLAKEGLLAGVADAPGVLALMTTAPKDTIALLRGAFKGNAAEFEVFLGQTVAYGASHQSAALAFLVKTLGNVPHDLVLFVLRSTGRWSGELEGGLVRLVAQAGAPAAKTALQGIPSTSIEPFLGLIRVLPDKAVATLAARAGALDALAKVSPRSLRAFAEIADGLPAGTVELASASNDFVAAVEAAGEVLDKFGLGHARAMYGEKLGTKTRVPAMWAQRLTAASATVTPAPLQPTSWILDAGGSMALTNVANGTADSNHTAVANELARLGVTDIRVTPTVTAETPPIPGITRGGIQLTVARTDPEYQAAVAILKTRISDAGDLAVTADALFAARNGAFDPPLFVADRGFANALARLATPPAPVGVRTGRFRLEIRTSFGPRSIDVVRFTP